MVKVIKLSIIVPVFNEEKTIVEILKRLLKVKQVFEIVVVNDGSTDKTAQLIKQFMSSVAKKKIGKSSKNKTNSTDNLATRLNKIKFFSKKNGGKGSAVRFGLSKITGNYVMIQDADLEYDPADIPAMLLPVQTSKAEVIYGSRFLGPHSNLLFWHRVGNFMLNFMVNILYNTTLSDMETCYKLLPTKLARGLNLQANSFDLEPEITCKVLRQGIRIFEVPMSYVGRDFAEGKKITWWDGFEALWVVLRERVG